jgi:nicotinamidase-related amidase
MERDVHLLIVDPQNDFMDAVPGGTPALPVPGAGADMERLAAFIDAAGDAITAITVTFDSHHRYHIAHPTFWQTGDGGAVAPFTEIRAAQVRAGALRPRDARELDRALAYLDALERQGRYVLMVWPVHCELGTWGHNVHHAVRAAYNRWEDRRLAVVQKVSKGSHPFTEHYSALQAEVPDAQVPGTQLNQPLVADLDRAATIVVAGEASSHCVRASTEHLAQYLPSGRLEKLWLLQDCMSPVSGFEAQARAFLREMAQRGARVTTSAEALRQLAG